MVTSAISSRKRETRDSVVIRFAGDSGDGMQVTGSQFTLETALAGSDFSTFPDFPAEIRAPTGTTFGVSAFQIHFGGGDVMTPGDAVDVLVAMNPAALTVELRDLKVGGTVIVDTAAFNERNLSKAGYARNPLEDDSLARYQVLKFDITKLTADAVKPHGLSSREAHLCRNMWALGLLLWMYGRERTATVEWLKQKFAKKPQIADANIAALNAGHAFGETAEMPEHLVGYVVPKAHVQPGSYRTVSGTEALAWGLVAGMRAAGIEKLVFAGYPITPASALLHTLATLRQYGVVTFQAEDEIAASGVELGTGDRAENRNARPRDRHRAAAHRDRLAARRPVDRHADQDRAVGPVAGGPRPQRRRPARGDRGRHGERLLRRGDRGGAPRH